MLRVRGAPGLVVAVRGRAAGGDFVVSGLCFPAPGPQKPLAPAPPSGQQRYLALASGLDIGKADPLPLQLMADYLCGHLGVRWQMRQ